MAGFGQMIVESPQRKMQLVSLKKSGLGTPVISGSSAAFCTVTDNGVGDYTINFTSVPFSQIPEILVAVKTNDRIIRVGTVTALAAQIITEDLAGAAAEADFDFMAIGSLARDLVGP